MVLLVSAPPWQEKPEDQLTRCRYFIRSSAFRNRFGPVNAAEILALVDSNVRKRRGGPVGVFTCALADQNGNLQEFVADFLLRGASSISREFDGTRAD